MSLHVTVRHTVGPVTLDVSLTTGAGLTALVGPSGAGKTTLLNIVAGLLRADTGVVRVDDEVLADTTNGVWIPPHRRRIGYVFQEPRLFPHLSVRSNLGYGRWFARHRPSLVRFDDVVSLCALEPLLARRTGKLSGGEKQRVALGRALLSQPRLLLLDEPLASVDVARREELLPYLDRLRAELRLPILYVTHTMSEVATRAERIVSLSEGRIVSGGQRAV